MGDRHNERKHGITRLEKLARVYHRVARLAGDGAKEVCDGGYIYIRRGRYEWRVLDTRPKVGL